MKLKLDLRKDGPGYAYEWRRVDGRVLVQGWSRGTKRDAREEADRHLADALRQRAAVVAQDRH